MNAPYNRGARRPMIRILLPFVYSLSESLEPLSAIEPNRRFGDAFGKIWYAHHQLNGFLNGSVFSPSLRTCVASGRTLLETLAQQMAKNEMEAPLDQLEAGSIVYQFREFKTNLLAELGTLPAYFVSQKGDRDTLTLLDQPHLMFPADLGRKVPEAMFDVAEAGKALCYETATACGFHLFRATEAVLRRYYTEATGGRPQPKVRNMAVYINAMTQRKCGDEKILSVLSQMSKLHRNPLIHPDVALTLDEAISILGISHSAITAMLAALPIIPPTTTTAVAVPTA